MNARAVTLAFLLILLSRNLTANELLVDERTLQMNDLATITVTLEGPFAANDFVQIPLQNLVLVGDPWVSSEFVWMNGNAMRRKVFRYRARPVAPGPARVGPIELRGDEGQVERLAAVAVQVLPDRAGGSNDAALVLRELLATGRDPFFVVAEADKQSVYVGEPVTVTWWMYNAAAVQEWQVVNVPGLPDFWSEELTREKAPERTYLDNVMVQRLPIRRVALYPLRSGHLRVEGVTIEGSVMRATRGGPFAMFEGEVVDTTFTSAPVDIDVKPVPDGAAVDAIGDYTLRCEPAAQKGNGPVVFRATLAGLGNVRSAVPPRFERGVSGTLQVEGGEVIVDRDDDSAAMTRRWQYLIFPSRTGVLEVPALTMSVFSPRLGARQELRCPGVTLDVVATSPPTRGEKPPLDAPAARRIPWTWLAAGAVLIGAFVAAAPALRREIALRGEVRRIVNDATPGEIRSRMEQRVAIPLEEASDRGDAWRALRSLLDAAERERDIAADADPEIARRVRDVLSAVRAAR